MGALLTIDVAVRDGGVCGPGIRVQLTASRPRIWHDDHVLYSPDIVPDDSAKQHGSTFDVAVTSDCFERARHR